MTYITQTAAPHTSNHLNMHPSAGLMWLSVLKNPSAGWSTWLNPNSSSSEHTVFRPLLHHEMSFAHIAALLHASFLTGYPAAGTQLSCFAKSLPWRPAAAPSPVAYLVTLAYRVKRCRRAPLRLQALRTANLFNSLALQPNTPVIRDSALSIWHILLTRPHIFSALHKCRWYIIPRCCP